MIDNGTVIKLGMSYFQSQRLIQQLSVKENIVIMDPQGEYEDYTKNLSENINLLETQ